MTLLAMLVLTATATFAGMGLILLFEGGLLALRKLQKGRGLLPRAALPNMIRDRHALR